LRAVARAPLARALPARVYTREMKTPCYCAAVRSAARRTTALYDAALAPAGVNIAQYSLLRKIERSGPVSLTELGRIAELDRSTVGRNAKVLERLRLVQLKSAEDQREAAVSLTAAGAEALRRGAPLWEEAQRQVEAALGSEAAERLRALSLAL
jgi:DNA-binding MarR family transcriptional regulator